jgi:hypothetical protein
MEIRRYEQSQTYQLAPRPQGREAIVDYFIALHSVPRLSDRHQYSDKSTADKARVGERGAYALQGHKRNSKSFRNFSDPAFRALGLVDDMDTRIWQWLNE